MQPACFHNAAAALIQLRQRSLQALGLQRIMRFLRQLATRLVLAVAQPVNRRKRIIFVIVLIVCQQPNIMPGHALFHLHHFGDFHAQIIGNILRFFGRQSLQTVAHAA